MKRERYHGNDIIRALTILGDFILLDILVYLCLQEFSDYTPKFFMEHNRVVLLAANFAMVVAEYFFHTILHHRRLSLFDIVARVFKLSVCQSVLMFFLLRVISDGGGFFRFMFVFAALLFVALFVVSCAESDLK